MYPKWTLSLLAALLHTVASAPESVFALEGNSVTLIMQRHNNMDTDDAVWVFNQSWDVVRYYPHNNKHRQLRILDSYRGRIEFDSTTFSLELTNPRKNDSGLYKGEINAEGRKAVSDYRLNVIEQVTAPVLTVESVSSSGDPCNVRVTCRAGDLSLTSTCDISSCTQEEQTAPSSLATFIKDDVIICNHSNPVSWDHATVELETLCQKPEFPLGDEQISIWIYITIIASGLVLLVLVLIGGVLCFGMHSKNQADISSKVYQSVLGIVPTEMFPEKKQSEVVCAKTLSPYSAGKKWTPSSSPSSGVEENRSQTLRPSSAVKMRTPFKSRSPYSVVVNLSQTPSSSSAVKRRTPFKSISPPSYAVVDLSQTQTPSSVVKSRTPFKSKSQSKAKENLLQTLSPSPAVKKQTHSTYGTPSSNTVENLLQTPSPSSAVRRRTPFKSRSRSKAKKNLSQKFKS